jgi:hypothetical protein
MIGIVSRRSVGDHTLCCQTLTWPVVADGNPDVQKIGAFGVGTLVCSS